MVTQLGVSQHLIRFSSFSFENLIRDDRTYVGGLICVTAHPRSYVGLNTSFLSLYHNEMLYAMTCTIDNLST